jgi:hypothetical protein
MKRLDIPDKSLILQNYTVSRSIIVTAKAFKVSYETMRMWLKHYGIPVGIKGQNNVITNTNREPLTEETKKKIGDANRKVYLEKKAREREANLLYTLSMNKIKCKVKPPVVEVVIERLTEERFD